MNMERKIKSSLFRIFCSVLICLGYIVLKFLLNNETLVEEVHNYLVTDIVFLK